MFGEAAEYTSGLVGARGHKKSMLLQSKCEERPSEGVILPEHEISFSVCIRAGIAPLLAVSLEQRFLASKHVYLQQCHIASSLSSMCDQWDFYCVAIAVCRHYGLILVASAFPLKPTSSKFITNAEGICWRILSS